MSEQQTPPRIYSIQPKRAKPAPKGTVMRATVNIKQGQRILAEAAIFEMPRVVADVFNDEVFLSEGEPFNGAHTIDQMLSRLSDDKKQALEGLYRKEDDIRSVIKCNAFIHLITDFNTGIEYKAAHVYNELSRVNHSCSPNAVVEWNHNIGMATLHTLKAVKRGDEITVNYLQSLTDACKEGNERRAMLNERWGFECRCRVCWGFGTRLDDAEEQQRKNDAADEHLTVTLYSHPDLSDAAMNQATQQTEGQRQSAVTNLGTYIAALKSAEIIDCNLARAYELRAKYYHQGYLLCENVTIQQSQRNGRRVAKDPEFFLKSAADDYRAATLHYMRCLGADHEQVSVVKREWEKMENLLAYFYNPLED